MWYETYYDRECADKRATGNFNLNWEIVDGLTATAQYLSLIHIWPSSSRRAARRGSAPT